MDWKPVPKVLALLIQRSCACQKCTWSGVLHTHTHTHKKESENILADGAFVLTLTRCYVERWTEVAHCTWQQKSPKINNSCIPFTGSSSAREFFMSMLPAGVQHVQEWHSTWYSRVADKVWSFINFVPDHSGQHVGWGALFWKDHALHDLMSINSSLKKTTKKNFLSPHLWIFLEMVFY